MKNKIAFSLVIVLLFWSNVMSQTYVFQVTEKGSKGWGYADLDGKVIIEPRFKISYEFSNEGCALVLDKRKFFIVNLKGEIVNTKVEKVKPYVDAWTGVVNGFSDGYLVVQENKKWGCLSTDGEIAVPLKYDRIMDFKDGYSLAILDKKIFIVDKRGTEVLVDVPGIVAVKHFSEGLGMIKDEGGKWGFIDVNGKVVVKPQFEGVGYFNAGLAWARTSGGKIGYINKKGEWVVKPQFETVRDFDMDSGLAMVKVNGKWGYVDKQDNVKFFEESEKPYIFSEGLTIGKKNGKIGFLDNKGQWVIQPQFTAARAFKNGYAAAESKNLWGIIDKKGNWVVKPVFTHVMDVAVVD